LSLNFTVILSFLDSLEEKFNSKILSLIFNYITAAHNGISEMELLDLLSCNNDFFTEYYSARDLPVILRFPIALWILVKSYLGGLIAEKYMDNKVTYFWSNELVRRIMKQQYFNKVNLVRSCHKEMANYFLEAFVETKPLVDMNRHLHKRDEEAKRYICQQPLLYSDTAYNYRRINEIWYHLMNTGDIQRLKEYTLFNYEYLLAKCDGMSVYALLNDIECICKRILDPDILLINSLLNKEVSKIVMSPLRLASIILKQLRPLEGKKL
jgi:NACHT domain- and WD repeat-containing protein